MVAEPRGLGLFGSTFVAGIGWGAVDALDALAGGFAGGLSRPEMLLVVLVSAAAVGALGAMAGLIAAFGASLARALGIDWRPGAGLVAGSRVVLDARSAAALAIAGIVAGGAAIWALVETIARGTGDGIGVAAAAIGAAALGLAAGLAVLLSRRWCPPAIRVALWLAGLAMLYFLDSRLIYSFSRLSPLAGLHVALLGVLVTVTGIGLWLSSRRLHAAVARQRWPAQALLLAGCVAAVAGVSAHECFGSHQTRLFLHGRTSLTFRALSLVPGCAARRATQIGRALRSGCGEAAPGPRASPAPAPASALRGVVLVLIDSMRADRLEARRRGRPLFPNLIELGRRSAFFANAYTVAPGTRHAIDALLAGSPSSSPATTTDLAEALRPEGIQTIAISGHANVTAATAGFDIADDRASRERFASGRNALTSGHITARARARLAELRSGQRFFLLVHYFDPHAHYVSNPLFDFGSGERARYDAELKYTDRWIGVLLEDLRRRPDVGVVVVSDHGEELWDHRYKRHQIRLYDESTRVPLIVFDPRVAGPSRHDQEVSIIDVAPTVLEMLGVAAPAAMRGQSLWPAVSGSRDLVKRPALVRSTNGERWGVVQGRRKLMFDQRAAILEYYDLAADPGESVNNADQPLASMGALPCSLGRWMSGGSR